MSKKTFQEILKEKREYYGNTAAAEDFAAGEYCQEQAAPLVTALRRVVNSMRAHPDFTSDNVEWTDRVEGAMDAINGFLE